MDPSCNQTHPDATDLPVSNVPKPTDDSVIQVRVKRVRLLLVTCVTVAFAASIVLSFRNGVPVYTFDASTRSLKETNKLIDDYNSYLANVASAFSRPISITIDIVTQVILLRFATALFCGGESQGWLQIIPVATVAALEYLVLNGINALNVRVQPRDVRPVMSISDLSYSARESGYLETDNVTNASVSYSEKTPGNPITNTALRSLLLPHVGRENLNARKCSGQTAEHEDMVTYGFPARSWQSLMLPNAPTTQFLNLSIDGSSSFDLAVTDRLPVNLSRARNLFANGVTVAATRLPWFGHLTHRYSGLSEGVIAPRADTLFRSPPENASAVEQEHLFLQGCREILVEELSVERTESARGLEFSHVDISSSITFDAVTFDVQLNSSIFPKDISLNYTGQLKRHRACGSSKHQSTAMADSSRIQNLRLMCSLHALTVKVLVSLWTISITLTCPTAAQHRIHLFLSSALGSVSSLKRLSRTPIRSTRISAPSRIYARYTRLHLVS